MKTTINLPDSLLERARVLAEREKTTIRALVEEGLRIVLDERSEAKAQFRLRPASISGQGLHPDAASASWESIREVSYQRPPA